MNGLAIRADSKVLSCLIILMIMLKVRLYICDCFSTYCSAGRRLANTWAHNMFKEISAGFRRLIAICE